MTAIDNQKRCDWVEMLGNDICVPYHDEEWGAPLHDDRKLFEAVILDGFQAGLSWTLMLKKRENFRRAFDQFDAEKIARYDQDKIDVLLTDAGIIRNKLKIHAAVTNARAYLDAQQEFGSFDTYIWGFVEHAPVQNSWRSMRNVPATSEISDRLSKDMKKRGFTFVGSTIMYAHMQATGMVNDHTVDCFRHRECRKLGAAISARP